MICSKCGQDQPRGEFGASAENWPSHRECKTCGRTRAQLRKHGLTALDRARIAAQQGGCAICGHDEPGAKGWVVDHDRNHCPGEKSCPECRRGVLCTYCNSMIGYAFDRVEILESAIDYLTYRGEHSWHAPIRCSPMLCGRDDA